MPIAALRHRVATMPAVPLLVHYDGAAGSRIELSGVTFANWVDKTCNFLDTLGVDPGDTVQLDLARSDPGHWVTAVWVAACWQRGCTVTEAQDPAAALIVAGPGALASGTPTVACSLHPLGLGFPEPPQGCVDYAEVLSEPDVHFPQAADPGQLAWAPDVTFAELAEIDPSSDRMLWVDPQPGWETVSGLLVAPLLGGGSSVVVTGGDQSLVDRVRVDERVTPL